MEQAKLPLLLAGPLAAPPPALANMPKLGEAAGGRAIRILQLPVAKRDSPRARPT